MQSFTLDILTAPVAVYGGVVAGENSERPELTHWGRVTHICVGKLTIIGSDNGLPPGRRQAIIWTNAGILLIGSLGTNFNEIVIEIMTFSFKKMRLKVSFAKWRPCCLGLNVLTAGQTGKLLSIKPPRFIVLEIPRGNYNHASYYGNEYKSAKYHYEGMGIFTFPSWLHWSGIDRQSWMTGRSS